MTIKRLLPALLLAACAPEVPDEPTWADVEPILAANCTRCHGDPSFGGAPSLAFDDYAAASALAPRIAARVTSEASPMPPPPREGEVGRGGPPLTDRQKEVLVLWSETGAPEE